MENVGEFKVTIKLEGYKTVKSQLNNIEKQIDRILEKQKMVGVDSIKLDYDRELKARGLR